MTPAVGLQAGAVEGNPLAASVLQVVGLPGMVLFKGGIVLGLYGLFPVVGRTTAQDLHAKATLFLTALGVTVTTWNLAVIAVH